MEIWKIIPDLDDNYEVSNYGRVRSLRFGKQKILSIGTDKKGYKRVSITAMGKCLRVHRLVANAFIPNPGNKPEVNHKDYDTSNNNDWNLEWATREENIAHSKLGKRRKTFTMGQIEELHRTKKFTTADELIKSLKESLNT